ncbi:hypothetical protein D3C71_403430 [compost metagenome]
MRIRIDGVRRVRRLAGKRHAVASRQQQGRAAAIAGQDFNGAFQHVHGAVVILLAHGKARAQRAHQAFARGHFQRCTAAGAMAAGDEDFASQQLDQAAAGIETHVHGRSRIQAEHTAIVQRHLAPLARGRAVVGAQDAHAIPGIRLRGQHAAAGRHAQPRQQLAPLAADGFLLRAGQCLRSRTAVQAVEALRHGFDMPPGPLMFRVRLAPALPGGLLRRVHLARHQHGQPLGRLLLHVLADGRRGRSIAHLAHAGSEKNTWRLARVRYCLTELADTFRRAAISA